MTGVLWEVRDGACKEDWFDQLSGWVCCFSEKRKEFRLAELLDMPDARFYMRHPARGTPEAVRYLGLQLRREGSGSDGVSGCQSATTLLLNCRSVTFMQ